MICLATPKCVYVLPKLYQIWHCYIDSGWFCISSARRWLVRSNSKSTRKIRNFSDILRCIAHFLLNRLYAPKVGYSIPQSKSLHLNLRPSEPTPRICCQNASMASCKLSPNAKTIYKQFFPAAALCQERLLPL